MKLFRDIILFLFAVPSVLAQELSPQEIFKKVSPSILTVYASTSGGSSISQGSAVVLNDSGWVVTNYHVFAGNDRILLKKDNITIEDIKIIGVDVEKDILILKIKPKIFPSLAIGNFDSLQVGQKVFAVGSPLGLENTLSEGIISALRFYDEGGARNFIQTNASISHGSSGGALMNAKGELIGITTQTMRGGQNLNFAILISDVLKVEVEDYGNTANLEIFNYYHKALSAFESKNYEPAIKNFYKVIELNSLHHNAHLRLGKIYLDLGEDDKAIEIYNQLLKVHPHFADAYHGIGIAFADQNKNDSARYYYYKALAVDSMRVESMSQMAFTFYTEQKTDSAMKWYEHALRIKPDYFIAYNGLGLLYSDLGKYEQAILNYEKAIKLNPKIPSVYENLADLYMREGNYEKAKGILTKALEEGIEGGLSYYNLALCYYKLKIFDRSIEYFMKVKEYEKQMTKTFGPEWCKETIAGSYYFLFVIYKDLKDKTHAEEYKEKAFDLIPDWKKMNEKEIMQEIK